MYSTVYYSPKGRMTLVASDSALLGAWFDEQKHCGGNLLSAITHQTETPLLLAARVWLDEYFAGHHPDAMPPLAPVGTLFRLAVWNCLSQIPYGTTTTYGELSKLLNSQGITACPQAVGSAIAHNPIVIFIPCHRVIGANGTLTGYAAGLPIKTYLLELEGLCSHSAS